MPLHKSRSPEPRGNSPPGHGVAVRHSSSIPAGSRCECYFHRVVSRWQQWLGAANVQGKSLPSPLISKLWQLELYNNRPYRASWPSVQREQSPWCKDKLSDSQMWVVDIFTLSCPDDNNHSEQLMYKVNHSPSPLISKSWQLELYNNNRPHRASSWPSGWVYRLLLPMLVMNTNFRWAIKSWCG